MVSHFFNNVILIVQNLYNYTFGWVKQKVLLGVLLLTTESEEWNRELRLEVGFDKEYYKMAGSALELVIQGMLNIDRKIYLT